MQDRREFRHFALCSLNWADQFRYLYTGEAWAEDIAEQLMAAYAGADAFLRCLPALPMPGLKNTVDIPPLACIGEDRRAQLEHLFGPTGERLVLVAMGGIGFQLPLAQGRRCRNTLADRRAATRRGGQMSALMRPLVNRACPSDLFASVDAIVTKPGYGTFVEAATAGTWYSICSVICGRSRRTDRMAAAGSSMRGNLRRRIFVRTAGGKLDRLWSRLATGERKRRRHCRRSHRGSTQRNSRNA